MNASPRSGNHVCMAALRTGAERREVGESCKSHACSRRWESMGVRDGMLNAHTSTSAAATTARRKTKVGETGEVAAVAGRRNGMVRSALSRSQRGRTRTMELVSNSRMTVTVLWL